jgi:hypothetical protein
LPDFLHAELERVACAVFFKENRMEHARSTYLDRKSGFGHKGIVSEILPL